MEITEELYKLAEIFYQNGRKLYVVGGSVRDSLLGLKARNVDYDLCSNVTPRELIDIIDGTEFDLKNINGKIGVMQIIGKEQKYEYVTFRKDIYDGESHYPVEVKFVRSLEEDVKRRDFKINSIYYDIWNKKIIDPLNGVDDLKNKVIRTTRNPKIVYDDDPERILRALRLSVLLDFTIPEDEMEILKKNIENLEYLSKKRIRKEFDKMILLDKFYENNEATKFAQHRMFELLGDLGIWKYMLPDMEPIMNSKMVNTTGERFYPYILNEVKYTPEIIRFHAMLENIAKAKMAKLPPKTTKYTDVLNETIDKNLGEEGLNYTPEEIVNVKKILFESKFNCGAFTNKTKLREFIFDNRFVYDELIQYKKNYKLDDKAAKKNAKTLEKLDIEYQEMINAKYPMTISELCIGGEELIKYFPKIKIDKLDELKEGILRRLVIQKKNNIKEDLIELASKEIESNKDNYLE